MAGSAVYATDFILDTVTPALFVLSATKLAIFLTIIDDFDIEGYEQFTVQITDTNFGTIDTSDTVTVTIKDNGKL